MRGCSPGTRGGLLLSAALLSVALLAAVVACDPSADVRLRGGATRDTIDGIVHVVSGNGGVWSGGASWTVRPAGVSIGEVDGPEEATFGEVAGLVVGEDGRIHVGDAQAREVRVFSRGGEFDTRFGRAGEGPGEFRNISGLSRAPDGIAVLDGGLGRVTVFRPDGSVARTIRLHRPYMIFRHGALMRFDHEGRFYDQVPLSGGPGIDSVGIVVYSPEGTPTDTVLVAVVRPDHLVIEREGRPIMSFPRPFAPQPSVAVGPDGRIYYARGDDYRITVRSPAGDTVHVLRRPYEPRPVTAGERDSAIAVIEERYREVAGGGAPRNVQLPATKPAIAALMVDHPGNLWVLVYPEPGRDRMQWAVHSRDGEYLGAVATPPMHVMDIGEDYIAGVSWDEWGVPRAEVREVVKPDGRPASKASP